MDILIIKHGALGDIVRTSYFAGALRRQWGDSLRLHWLTARSGLELLKFNRYIDHLTCDVNALRGVIFDRIYSLDDEIDAARAASSLRSRAVTGAVLDAAGCPTYTDDACEWFDMGLLSRFGKARADELKRSNTKSHAQIFSRLFGVGEITPEFAGDPAHEAWAKAWRGVGGAWIGINAFAGGRWPAKELPALEFESLARCIVDDLARAGGHGRLVLLGAGDDRARVLALASNIGSELVLVPDTDASVLRFAAVINELDYLVTTDSLALHLAISQGIRHLAFFTATSAAEIDTFGIGTHVVSTAADYCSYRKDACNRSITSERILAVMQHHEPSLLAARMARTAP